MFHLRVQGLPGPQGSKTHLGRGVMVESSKRVKPWRDAVRAEALRMGVSLPDGPVWVTVKFYLPRPASASRRAWPHLGGKTAGDVDKLIRSTLDALVDAGALVDDSRVVRVWAEKTYADTPPTPTHPGAYIAVYSMEPR